MKRKFLVADLLCGAGGSSTGCAQALTELGLEMDLACVNHWGVAIETHKQNHPEARHYVQDIATCRPHLIVPEGYLDLLMASPTCTHHSVARGGKPTSDQQRSDPWHIITWLTELRVKRVIIENVWEFIEWGPVDPRTGRPIKSRKGEYFRAWIDTIRRLGFDPEWRKLNAADYGDATTRQRFILMARSDRKPVVWPVPTHMRRTDDKLALFPGVQPWRPARDIIDWTIKGKSIFARKKPLASKTLARIYAGAVKFGWPYPFLVILRNHMTAQSLDGPLPTISAGGTHIGIAEPVIYNGRRNNKAKGVSEAPVPTLDSKGGVWLAEPFVVAAAHSGREGETNPHRGRLKSLDDPIGTVHAGGGNFAIAEPIVLSQHNSGMPRSAGDPLPTITTGGAGDADHKGCARPMLIEPFILSRQGGGAPRSTDEPAPTQCAKHSHVLISSYYGSGSGTVCQSANAPLPTVTSKERFGVVVPVTHTKGSNQTRDVAEPLPTITTAKGGEFALVMPTTHADGHARVQNPAIDPLPTVTGAHRGELAYVVGDEQHGYDILFRMLEPHELAAAMGLTDYKFAGTKTEKVKQIGNAVSVKKMRACVAAIMADAVPKRRTQPQEPRKEAAA